MKRLFAALAVLACLGAAAPVTVTVPAILSLTGGLAFQGREQQQLLQLLETAADSEPSNGVAIHFDFLDDQSNPQTAIELMNQAVAQKVPAVVGPDLTQNCMATLPVVAAGPVAYCTSPGAHPPAGSYMFSGGIDARDIQLVAIRYFRSIGVRRFGALWSVDATGQDSERAFKAAMALPENKDLQVVVNDHFSTSDMNVSAQMAHLREQHAQVCFCWASGSAFTTIARGYNDAGLSIPLFSSTANMTYPQMEQLASRRQAPYFVGFKYFSEASSAGASADAILQFRRAMAKAKLRPDSSAGNVWDAGHLVIAAIRSVGPNATATQVRDYIEHLSSYPGIDGTYDFTNGSQRGLSASEAIMTQWDPKAKTWLERRPGA